MDKFSAVWLSHSSINTFKSCPRTYYLSSIYRDPRTGHKIALTTPAMSLGTVVHSVIESLSILPVTERFKISLIAKFQTAWEKVHGQLGGFPDEETEKRYYNRGEDMLRRVMNHPGPLLNKAVKIKADLPYYWISEEDNLILCGKLDWLEYLESEDAVNIIDFKTGVGEEKVDSLQLPIYYLLAHNCQSHEVKGASYWYINRDDLPTPKKLPDLDKSKELVMKIGKEMKLARSLNRFKCPEGAGGCKHCQPYEKIVRGDALFVGTGDYGADVYMISDSVHLPQSEIL
jgi:hypothetical protein